MDKRKILVIICFLFLLGLVTLTSNDYLRGRIQAHIDAWLGRVKLAENIIVTFPEGSTNEEMADVLGEKIPNFDKNLFLEKTKNMQGYLFPDTYFFWKLTTVDDAISTMQKIFDKKLLPLITNSNSKYSEKQIIIMASLVQKEANGKEDSASIAGILWKRFESGMALQVDAAPITYKERGLPNAPINNPGIVAVTATLHPLTTPYLYYLHDKSGMIHFAKTYAEHQKNIKEYLK
jgi:UPF0755 protein